MTEKKFMVIITSLSRKQASTMDTWFQNNLGPDVLKNYKLCNNIDFHQHKGGKDLCKKCGQIVVHKSHLVEEVRLD